MPITMIICSAMRRYFDPGESAAGPLVLIPAGVSLRSELCSAVALTLTALGAA